MSDERELIAEREKKVEEIRALGMVLEQMRR